MSDITELLLQWNSGSEDARASLIKEIYSELSAIAARHLANERHVVELQPSSLVHEAYLRLIDLNRIEWKNRTHFFAIAAKVMRDILIDRARKRTSVKRDGGQRVTLSGIGLSADEPSTDVLMLNEALDRLADIDPDRAKIVELRFFGGMTIEETAEVMGKSPATIKRNWDVARGWLYRAMKKDKTQES